MPKAGIAKNAKKTKAGRRGHPWFGEFDLPCFARFAASKADFTRSRGGRGGRTQAVTEGAWSFGLTLRALRPCVRTFPLWHGHHDSKRSRSPKSHNARSDAAAQRRKPAGHAGERDARVGEPHAAFGGCFGSDRCAAASLRADSPSPLLWVAVLVSCPTWSPFEIHPHCRLGICSHPRERGLAPVHRRPRTCGDLGIALFPQDGGATRLPAAACPRAVYGVGPPIGCCGPKPRSSAWARASPRALASTPTFKGQRKSRVVSLIP